VVHILKLECNGLTESMIWPNHAYNSWWRLNLYWCVVP